MTQKIWGNPPLYYSLAQLVFNEIPNLEQYVSEISESLSSFKFTDYKSVEIDSVHFSIEKGNEAKIQTDKKKQWNFFNKSRKSVFSLGTNTLVFATTEYQGRDDFTQNIMKGIEAVNLSKKLDFIDRIGVRHIDVIIPSTDKTALNYINMGLHGIEGNDSLKKINQTTEALFTNGLQWVICRSMLREFPEGLIDPENFMGLLSLNVNDKFILPRNMEIACIDIDSFTQDRIDFDLQNIESNLLTLRGLMDPIFKNSVTKLAIGEWK